MTWDEFKDSLPSAEPPDVNSYLMALWYDRRGDWDKSHDIIQEIDDSDAAWIHGYLHRKEGDHWNAGYWYRRAGKEMPDSSLDDEWEYLCKKFLAY